MLAFSPRIERTPLGAARAPPAAPGALARAPRVRTARAMGRRARARTPLAPCTDLAPGIKHTHARNGQPEERPGEHRHQEARPRGDRGHQARPAGAPPHRPRAQGRHGHEPPRGARDGGRARRRGRHHALAVQVVLRPRHRPRRHRDAEAPRRAAGRAGARVHRVPGRLPRRLPDLGPLCLQPLPAPEGLLRLLAGRHLRRDALDQVRVVVRLARLHARQHRAVPARECGLPAPVGARLRLQGGDAGAQPGGGRAPRQERHRGRAQRRLARERGARVARARRLRGVSVWFVESERSSE